MRENRKYARLDIALKTAFKRQGPDTTLKGTGTTKDISAHGLRLTSKPLALGVGEKLSLRLNLPTGETISCGGRVKWVHPVNSVSQDVGVEITEIDMEEQNRYLLFVCDLMYDRLQTLRLL